MNNYKFRGKTVEGKWVYGFYYANPNNGIYRIRWACPDNKDYFQLFYRKIVKKNFPRKYCTFIKRN